MSALSSRRVDNMSVTADLNTHARARVIYDVWRVRGKYTLCSRVRGISTGCDVSGFESKARFVRFSVQHEMRFINVKNPRRKTETEQ